MTSEVLKAWMAAADPGQASGISGRLLESVQPDTLLRDEGTGDEAGEDGDCEKDGHIGQAVRL